MIIVSESELQDIITNAVANTINLLRRKVDVKEAITRATNNQMAAYPYRIEVEAKKRKTPKSGYVPPSDSRRLYTDAQLINVMRALKNGATLKEAAQQTGVGERTVWYISKGQHKIANYLRQHHTI